nr:hypothetical protein [uncultured Moraxella sp.]
MLITSRKFFWQHFLQHHVAIGGVLDACLGLTTCSQPTSEQQPTKDNAQTVSIQ